MRDGQTREIRNFGSPLPTWAPANGEFDDPPRTREQSLVRATLAGLTERYRARAGLGRLEYLSTASGLAAGFLAMNMVYGQYFGADEAEAADLAYGEQRAGEMADQFILDDQTHYAHEGYPRMDVLALREYARWRLNPALRGERRGRDSIKIKQYMKEIFLQSDTKIATLTSATADDKKKWFLTNEQMAEGRRRMNAILGKDRVLTHAMFAPGHDGWLAEVDRAVEEIKPVAWKGYTCGDPFHYSRFPYRLDDEKLVYPAYERFLKAGIRTVCVHKGLMPASFLKRHANWKYGSVDDLPQAAADWPDLNFVVYHAAYRPSLRMPHEFLAEFERTGRMEWVTDLAEIPEKHGVTNVYADVGTTFGVTAVTHPGIAAAILGTLVKGLGEDHVCWGTDSIWYGSPQWQIEAFRRIEIPEQMQARFGFSPLGGPRSPVKEKILGRNTAKLYGLDPDDPAWRTDDRLAGLRRAHAGQGDKLLDELFGRVP